jgi:hypothetical protein
MLIDKDANVDAQDKDGRPPLHYVINSKLKGGTSCIRLANKYQKENINKL